MNPRTRPSRRQSVTDDFERETKLVVLNFMGLVPASCPATAEFRDTVRVDVSSDDDEDMTQRSHGTVPCVNCDLQPVPEVPGEENCSIVTGNFQNGEVSGHGYSELLDNKEIYAAEVVVDTCSEDGDVHLSETADKDDLPLDSHMQSSSTADSANHHILRPPRNSTHQTQLVLLQTPVVTASSRTPSPSGPACPALVERQSSSRSTTSSRSRSSATRNANINVQLADLETLVRTHALPPLVIPLRDEISHEMEVLGQEHHEADTDTAQELAHSPETEVADMLRTVGDHVNEEFGEILSEAVAAILPPQAVGGDIPYATLRSVAESLIEHVHPGWSQVAMVLLFSQRLAFSMLLQGHSRIGNLADNTTRFIEDHVADFIISNGGWQSILDMEMSELLPESSNEAQSSVDELDDRGQAGDTDHRISSQGQSQADADAGHEFVPDCHSVPSLSADVTAVNSDIHPSNIDTDGDSDIFMYLALGATVLILASALYKQVLK